MTQDEYNTLWEENKKLKEGISLLQKSNLEILKALQLATVGLINNTAIKDYCVKVINKYKK